VLRVLAKGNGMRTPEEDAKRVIDATLESGKELAPCLICGSLTHNRGIFNPNNSKAFGAQEGKSRFIIYPLCERHPQNIKTIEKVEAKIIQQYRTV
jgi:hypothetical protein